MYKRGNVLILVLATVLNFSLFGVTNLLHAGNMVTVPASSLPSNPIYENGKFYFIAYPTQPEPFSKQMARLWSTDGTPAGTRMVSDLDVKSVNICGGSAMVARNDRLIFAAKNESSGEELWFHDVKTNEAGPIMDIYQGKADSLPCILANANGTIFFSAFDNPHGASLWKTDGTPSGTHKIKENLSPAPQPVLIIGYTIFFVANDDVHGFELWRSDGASAGTFLVKDIAPGAADSNIGSLTSAGKTVYFAADDGKSGAELWKSDGTPGGTVLVKDLIPGKAGSNPHSLTTAGTVVHFGADPDEWWKSDGTSQGTVKVGKQLSGQLIALTRSLFVAGKDEDSGISALWNADPDTGRLEVIKEFGRIGLDSVVFNNLLYFSADDCQHGVALWKSDGTSAGTLLVSVINPIETQDASDSSLSNLTVAGDTLFFAGNDGLHGTELWKSDGTANGTLMVKDLASGSGKTVSIPPPPRPPDYQSPCQKFLARHQEPKASVSHEQIQSAQKSSDQKSAGQALNLEENKDIVPPELLQKVDPVYVVITRKARIQGTVELDCILDTSGNVTVQKVLKSLHPLLDKSATDAVNQWKYKPATLHGKPVKTNFTVSVTFSLPLINQDIVDLLKAGLNEENLIAKIEAAKSVEFDLSPDQLKYLLAQGVSNNIIATMQKRQSGLK